MLQGTRLFIDGKKVIENDGPKATLFEATSQPIPLSRGWHPVRLLFGQGPDHFNGASCLALGCGAKPPVSVCPGANACRLDQMGCE